MTGYHEEGLYVPYAYGEEQNKPYAPSRDGDDLLVTENFAPGNGDWPVAVMPDDLHDFWANIKTMYYTINVDVEVMRVNDDWGYVSFGYNEMVGLVTTGVTRRFYNHPNRSPGWHKTFERSAHNGVNANAVSAISIDLSKTVYAFKSRAPKGTYWFPKIKVDASINDAGMNMHVSSGGTDGYLSFDSVAPGTMPPIPSIGLSVMATGGATVVGDPILTAALKPLERYDMIHFYPKLGAPGTTVTIEQPACAPGWDKAAWREGFKHVKEVWIGDKKITTFNPNTHVTGQQKEFITVTIPAGAKTGPFRFMAKYDNQPGFDDYYHTWQDFSVR